MINPENITVTQKIELIDSLYVKLDNAFSMHNAMKETDLYNNIIILKTDVFLTLIRSYSSGRISSIIGSNKYSDTDKATEKAVDFIMNADPEQIEQINIQDLDSVVLRCYHDKLLPGVY